MLGWVRDFITNSHTAQVPRRHKAAKSPLCSSTEPHFQHCLLQDQNNARLSKPQLILPHPTMYHNLEGREIILIYETCWSHFWLNCHIKRQPMLGKKLITVIHAIKIRTEHNCNTLIMVINGRLILHSINIDLISTVRGNMRELWATMSSVILRLGSKSEKSPLCLLPLFRQAEGWF